ncbi:MAG: hypothetical protein DWP98_00175 [Bacteroidetes bacterium]|nr:MAG: hypothetical protein DWP98_00175 [Bacteroidota bacterium]MBL1144592.1 hypothetical protein [Bacteroidota bacterium]MCB0802253.1 hypothetical protein [Flavobacteriales bacterium]NOG57387.1 hypothetical protein [Bacteroidota bacterium]
MESTNKPRLVTSFEKIDKSVQEQIKLEYPEGFSQHLISFMNKDGEKISALRFETDEKIYLIKMSKMDAIQLIEDDDDYDDDGNLTDEAREEYGDESEVDSDSFEDDFDEV